MVAINLFLDQIPRLAVRCGNRSIPAFRAGGAAGFYLGLFASAAMTLLTGLSLSILGGAVAAAVASFFLWALARRAMYGRESLVVMEHLWLAFGVAGGTLYALRAPVLPYLDIVAIGLGIFLALGRMGCLLVGCCHGGPSSLGIRYGKAHAQAGLPEYLVDIRLFPVQALESVGLLMIAAVGIPMVIWGRAGASLAWFLFSYAVLRFATEALRGDERPHLYGISVARVMCLVQACVAVLIADQLEGITIVAAFVVLGAALLLWWWFDWARRVQSRRNLNEMRRIVDEFSTAAAAPVSATTSAGVTIAVSQWHADTCAVHVSLRFGRHDDLRVMCHTAARAFPHLRIEDASYSEQNTLHFALPQAKAEAKEFRSTARKLYQTLMRDRVGAALTANPAGMREIPWFWRASA